MSGQGQDNAPLLGNASEPDPVKLDKDWRHRSAVRIGSGINTEGETDHHETPVAGIWLYISIFSCVIGTSFSFGYSLGCVNTPALVIKGVYSKWYNNTYHTAMPSGELTFLWSATVSIYCLGGLVCGCIGGIIADKFGRKRTLMVANILQILATLIMFSSIWIQRYEVIIVGRLIYGLYGGIATVVCPMYLNEISPPALKGKVGTIHQLLIVISLSLAQVLGLSQILGSKDTFYYLLALPIVPALIHWVMFAMCPESPSWLYLFKKDKEGAREALEKLRDMDKMFSVNSELAEYHKQELDAAAEPQVSLKDIFTTYRRRPLVISCVMMCSQQLSGINAVIFYSTSIFEHAKLSNTEAQYATLSLGGLMLIVTIISLILIERLGRRTLHLHGLGGCFISHALLTAFFVLQDIPSLQWMSYLCIVSIALFLISFNIGPGSIPWFYTTEISEPSSSKWIVSIATATNWFCNFIVGLSFPSLQEALKDYVFLPFLPLIAIFWAFLYYRAPETKGKTVLEITSRFKTLHSVATLPAPERRHYQTFTTT